jgi:hypothetical protein
MKRKTILLTALFSPLLFISSSLLAFTISGPDTCTVNDECDQAFWIPGVQSLGASPVCLPGCNLYASPDPSLTNCNMNIYPTVWYFIESDNLATGLNIEIVSSEIEMPAFAVFSTNSDCQSLIPVPLPGGGGFYSCVIGTNGMAKAIGIPISSNTTYYIAVSSLEDIGGNFTICVGTESDGFNCVIDRSIEIKARSNGGPLEGPFDPEETISFCLNVNEFSASGNGCQWFQGLVPVFGNGWDPSSFNQDGQPLNTLLNNDTIGEVGNGLYGATTWDWFTDVNYHYDRADLNIGDHDNNGTLDICNSTHELNCPEVGITGGCCGPCWSDISGTFLPGGWFAYGINGTCATPGPPVGVDWGDGNTCGGGMGPWSFCFDLTTRQVPDCMLDSTRKDLSIGFYTFADGETGSWTGSASVCALDYPLKLSLQAKCGRVTMLPPEQLPVLCSGDTLRYQVVESGVSSWEWNMSPFWAVPYETNQGVNGFMIETPLVNTSDQPVTVNGVFIGFLDNGANDKIIKQFTFQLNNAETCETVSTEPAGGSVEDEKQLRAYPVPANESVILEWSFDLQKDATIEVYNSHGVRQDIINVSSADRHQKRIDMSDWTQGIYFISLGNGEFRYVTRMVKL